MSPKAKSAAAAGRPRPKALAAPLAALGIPKQLLEPRVLKAELPEQGFSVRLAWLDLEERCLTLCHVSFEEGAEEVELGERHQVPFPAIGHVAACDGAVRVEGHDGQPHVHLHLDSTEEAQAWIQGLRIAAVPPGQAPKPTGTSESDERDQASAAALRELCAKQEDRLKQLEDLNGRKEQHLLKLHNRIEESLSVLQDGQRTYAENQAVLDSQQEILADLLRRLSVEPPSDVRAAASPAAAAASPPSTPAPAPSSETPGRADLVAKMRQIIATPDGSPEGPTLPESDGDEEDEDDDDVGDQQMVELMTRLEELQQQVQVFEAERPMEPGGAEAGAVAGAEAAAILEKLQGLVAEKDKVEAQLKGEQAQLERQLQELYSEMRIGPGSGSGSDDGDGSD